jgi:hypothetical protein
MAMTQNFHSRVTANREAARLQEQLNIKCGSQPLLSARDPKVLQLLFLPVKNGQIYSVTFVG